MEGAEKWRIVFNKFQFEKVKVVKVDGDDGCRKL